MRELKIEFDTDEGFFDVVNPTYNTITVTDNSPVVYMDLIGKRFYISIGSGRTANIWDSELLLRELKNGIYASWFDFDFYYNYLDFQERKEYKDAFIRLLVSPALNDIPKTFAEYFYWKTVWYLNSEPMLYLISDSFNDGRRAKVSEWIMNCHELSMDIRRTYAEYRKSYADEDIAI